MKALWLKGLALMVSALMVSAPVQAYDRGMAEGYAEMFKPVVGAAVGKKLHMIPADKYVQAVRQGNKVTTVDIRTPGEMHFFTANLPNHKSIPLAELFEHRHLESLPTDGKIVVLCKSGTRASAAVMALRSVGFENAYMLKGGYKALAGYLGPKEAYAPLGPKAAER